MRMIGPGLRPGGRRHVTHRADTQGAEDLSTVHGNLPEKRVRRGDTPDLTGFPIGVFLISRPRRPFSKPPRALPAPGRGRFPLASHLRYKSWKPLLHCSLSGSRTWDATPSSP